MNGNGVVYMEGGAIGSHSERKRKRCCRCKSCVLAQRFESLSDLFNKVSHASSLYCLIQQEYNFRALQAPNASVLYLYTDDRAMVGAVFRKEVATLCSHQSAAGIVLAFNPIADN